MSFVIFGPSNNEEISKYTIQSLVGPNLYEKLLKKTAIVCVTLDRADKITR